MRVNIVPIPTTGHSPRSRKQHVHNEIIRDHTFRALIIKFNLEC